MVRPPGQPAAFDLRIGESQRPQGAAESTLTWISRVQSALRRSRRLASRRRPGSLYAAERSLGPAAEVLEDRALLSVISWVQLAALSTVALQADTVDGRTGADTDGDGNPDGPLALMWLFNGPSIQHLMTGVWDLLRLRLGLRQIGLDWEPAAGQSATGR